MIIIGGIRFEFNNLQESKPKLNSKAKSLIPFIYAQTQNE